MSNFPNLAVKGFGRQDDSNPRAYYMLGFNLHREEVAAADTDISDITASIDMDKAVSADANQILLAVRRTAGAGTALSVKLMGLLRLSSNIPLPMWVPLSEVVDLTIDTTAQGDADPINSQIVRFSDLPAGTYKIVVTDVNGSTWDLYEAHTANPR